MAELVAEHLFEAAGLGRGPFRCVGMYSIPSPALQAANPDAYNNALKWLPRGYGCGTCAYCGQAIMHCYLINGADDSKFAVGCECVAKTGDAKLIEKAELEKRRAARAKRKAEQDAKQAARAEACRIANAAREAERQATERRATEAREARRGECTSKNAWLIGALRAKTESPFCADMADKLETTHWADMNVSSKAVAIMRDIYAKQQGGRAGSKAYQAAAAKFDASVAPPSPSTEGA